MAEAPSLCDFHSLSDIEDLQQFRSNLLGWYDVQKRELPWRTLVAEERDPNKRAYAEWVSEIMLQQTRVATVIDYYNRWMKKWPTVADLAAASLEEVRTMWSGLGYYSRGQRLWEGAKKVVDELGGEIPCTADQLMKTLPGVGQYTAGAIASIAFGQVTGVVDGNVMRVFSRHRVIGAEINKQPVIQHVWRLANASVDPSRPGDFNQALMELGATVCTPKSPQCHSCPLHSSCTAFDEVKKRQQESSLHRYCRQTVGKGIIKHEEEMDTKDTRDHVSACPLCLSEEDYDPAVGVTNYPRKLKKKEPPSEYYAVGVVEDSDGQLLLRQRPQTGLLAGLWEFPAVPVEGKEPEGKMWDKLHKELFIGGGDIEHHHHIGLVIHQFSHIHYHCHCWHVKKRAHSSRGNPLAIENTKWVERNLLTQQPISALVKKIFHLYEESSSEKPKRTCNRKKARPSTDVSGERSAKRQKTIGQFFTK